MVTLIASVMIMVGYFLLLWSVVAFIQDKRFFTTAPKEVQAKIPERDERFRGAHALGWCIIAFALMLFAGAIALAAWNGVKNGFGFGRFFARYLIMLYIMETYDILFFDWFLLCRSDFFPHYYPEVKGLLGPHLFGFNMKQHIRHYVLYIPVSALIAWACTLL